MAKHRDVSLGARHAVHDLEFADASARTSFVAVAADVGRVSLQLDTLKFYILTDDSPLVWDLVSPAANGPAGGDLTGTYPNPTIPHVASTSNPHSVTKAQVGLTNVQDSKVNLAASAAPTATDDSGAGYSVGSRWIDTTADKEYVCLDSTTSAAVWTETTGGGGGGTPEGENEILASQVFS